jgi:hypothetical protein
MTPAAIDQSTKRIDALHAESYAEWMVNNVARWGTPWRDEYARPVYGPYPMSPPDSPWAAARQARGLAKLNHRGPYHGS